MPAKSRATVAGKIITVAVCGLGPVAASVPVVPAGTYLHCRGTASAEARCVGNILIDKAPQRSKPPNVVETKHFVCEMCIATAAHVNSIPEGFITDCWG